jgi:hypothetical protein
MQIDFIAVFFHYLGFLEDEKKRQMGRVAGEKI